MTKDLATRIRLRVLERSHAAHVGHIGSCLCVADILAAVYASDCFSFSTDDPDRDRFVLGKGHAGLALLATLESLGLGEPGVLDSFGQDGSAVGVHPESATRGIDFSAGSLGQGLGVAVGAALAARIVGSPRKVVTLLSDAECDAGATWEAAAFAGHHQLANLVAIVDANGQQALGSTEQILALEPLPKRWELARWEVREVDGHDLEALRAAVRPSACGPVVVVARTVFGRGVSFMERSLDWHYLPMTDEHYLTALAEVSGAGVGR